MVDMCIICKMYIVFTISDDNINTLTKLTFAEWKATGK